MDASGNSSCHLVLTLFSYIMTYTSNPQYCIVVVIADLIQMDRNPFLSFHYLQTYVELAVLYKNVPVGLWNYRSSVIASNAQSEQSMS